MDLKPLDYFKKEHSSNHKEQPRSSLLAGKKQDYQSELKTLL